MTQQSVDVQRRSLVLASASPARRRTLQAVGVDPVVQVSTVDEDAVLAAAQLDESADPAQVVALLARAKAQDVAGGAAPPGALVLGCDSMLEFGGRVMGKPDTAEMARRRWHELRGNSGVLYTGHHLIDTASGRSVEEVAATVVHFAQLRDDEIDAYVASGEPLAVAGAFTIDGLAAAYITGIEGDHHNVVGVSVPLLRRLCDQLGVVWHSLWRDGTGAA